MKLLPTLHIGTQNALLILPLFLFLSWASAVMSFHAIRAELRWGFDEEALALATSTASFLDTETLDALGAGDDAIRSPLVTLRQWGQLRTLAVLDLEGQPLTPLIGDEEAAVPARPQLAWATAEPHLGELVERDDQRFFSAFAPLLDAQDTVVAWVRVETGAEQYAASLDAFRRRAWLQVAAPLGLGGLVVVLLTRLVAPRLRDLASAAQGVRYGRYEARLQDSTVGEINDLVGTFRTMTSVLGESIGKARRAVVDHEQFRTWDDIARAWVRDALPDLELDVGDLQVVAGLGPVAPPSRALHLAPTADEADTAGGFVAFLGELRGDNSRDLAARAAGLGFYLDEHVDSRQPEQLVAELRTHFDLERGILCIRRRAGEPIDSLRFEANRPVITDRLDPTTPCVFATGGHTEDGVDALLDLLGSVTAADLREDLPRLLPALRGEALLVIASGPTLDGPTLDEDE